mmetsp:Transcript_20495/g.28467  ORF Transcript_20495/g.28467 Transcript_20495/m.28467 type:complete len:170 (-) Transcript_20495:535-1044(-)
MYLSDSKLRRPRMARKVLKQKEAADDALVHATDVQSDSSMSRSNSKLPSMGKYSPTLTSSNNIDEARWGHGMENTTTMLPPQHGEGKIVPASEINANPVSVHFAPLPSRDSNTNVNVGNGMAPAVRSQRTLSNTSSKSSGKRGRYRECSKQKQDQLPKPEPSRTTESMP